jgi:hypothetical protein
MINVPKLTSPKITEIQSQKSRIRIRNNAAAKKYRELHAAKRARETNVDDKQSMIAMVLADQEIPSAIDIDAQSVKAALEWEATEAAEQSLDAPLAAAKGEAATDILKALKKPHDEVMKRLLAALVEASAANAELFQLSRDLRDKEIGFRCGVCELIPSFLGVPHAASEFAQFMRDAVAAGYWSALPKEFRA